MAERHGPLQFLKRLRRLTPARPAASADKGPELTRLALSATGANPIHTLLDDLRLPWHAPRSAVEQELGIGRDPFYRQDVVCFKATAPLPGFLTPWTARVFARFSPDLPITDIDGIVWSAPDTHANVRQAHDELARHFGAATLGRRYNTLVCGWQCGAAAVRLIAWPPEWQSPGLSNDAHAAEPRLVTACHVRLQTGFRVRLSAQEKAWLDEFSPVASKTPVLSLPIDRIIESAAGETELEYVRESSEALLRSVVGLVGHASDRKALIFCTHQLFVIALELILAFEVDRLLPAKGAGGSMLYVRCRTTCPGVQDKRIAITSNGEPDGLNDLGHELASAFGKPVEIGAYDYDA